jgi:Ca2+/Na+ antiporter
MNENNLTFWFGLFLIFLALIIIGCLVTKLFYILLLFVGLFLLFGFALLIFWLFNLKEEEDDLGDYY